MKSYIDNQPPPSVENDVYVPLWNCPEKSKCLEMGK